MLSALAFPNVFVDTQDSVRFTLQQALTIFMKQSRSPRFLLAVWYQTLQEYEQLDYRTLSDCAPLLAGEGMISLSNFAQSVELPVAQLIQAVMNRNLPVFWLATGQAGFYVAALSEAELDPLDGSYVLNYGEEKGIEGVLKAICNSLRNQHIYVTLLATVIQKLRCSKLPEATLKAVGFSPPVGR